MSTVKRLLLILGIFLVSSCIPLAPENSPPEAPELSLVGVDGRSHTIFVSVTGRDPDRDDLAYEFTIETSRRRMESVWSSYVASGLEAQFALEGDPYESSAHRVQVRARDEMNETSDFSEPLVIESLR
jgi:hypothetical protein